MTNAHRCEVALPQIGEGLYLRFTLADLAELETEYGLKFFDVIEEGAAAMSVVILTKCLSVGLKRRSAAGEERAWGGLDKDALLNAGFYVDMAARPVMDAITLSWMGKSYQELVDAAQAAEKERVRAAVKQVKEAADEAGLPFDGQASLEALFKLLMSPGSAQSESGA